MITIKASYGTVIKTNYTVSIPWTTKGTGAYMRLYFPQRQLTQEEEYRYDSPKVFRDLNNADEISAINPMNRWSGYGVSFNKLGREFHLNPVEHYKADGEITSSPVFDSSEVHSLPCSVVNEFTGTKYYKCIYPGFHKSMEEIVERGPLNQRSFVMKEVEFFDLSDYGGATATYCFALVSMTSNEQGGSASIRYYWVQQNAAQHASGITQEGEVVRSASVPGFPGAYDNRGYTSRVASLLREEVHRDLVVNWECARYNKYQRAANLIQCRAVTKGIADNLYDYCYNAVTADVPTAIILARRDFTSENLSFEALQDIGMWDSNGIAYVKDAAESAELLKGFIESAKALPSKKVKAAASIYLAAHYGLRLTIADTRELKSYLNDASHFSRINSCSSSHQGTVDVGDTQFSYIHRYQIYYDKYKALNDLLSEYATQLDFDFALENVWDMVPFSFVIDWFTKTSECLTAVDNYTKLASTYDIVGCCQSTSVRAVITLPDTPEFNCRGNIAVTGYDRKASNLPSTPVPSSFTKTTSPLKHLLEGASLIVQCV